MECMLSAPGDLVELRLEPTNPLDDNAVTIFSDRDTQPGYRNAERAPLIGKRMRDDEASAVFQAMHVNGPKSGSGSEASCLPCPTCSPMFRSTRLSAKRARRSDRSTIPTRSIMMRRGRSSKHRAGGIRSAKQRQPS